jgi:hypothetical protein
MKYTYGVVGLSPLIMASESENNDGEKYPASVIRAGMVDVGRMYIPIGYLEEMGLYMASYKMNELHVHLNDYWGASKYSAFRLQSERYPGIVATDGFYTKDEYRAFQKAVRAYGVDVVSEIDTPYHAESFRGIPGITMISAGQMEIRTEPERTNVVNLITDLFDEYLEGPDPVFVGKKVHVGTDEYLDNTAQAREAMRDYTDRLIKYVNNYESEAHPDGLEARVWASLGGGGAQRGFTGTTPVSSDAVLNLWAPYWAGAEYTYELGSDIINTYGGFLYIVPGANAGYPDRWNGLYQNNGYHNYNFDFLYNTFNVNNYNATRNANLGGTGVLPIAHPRSVGAQFCVWNDMTSFYGGISEFDVFDRMRDAVALVSEKTWYGEQTEGQTAESFIARAKKLGNQAPGANPARFVASETDFVAGYNFRASDALSDLSGNGYDASGTGTTATGEGLRLNGGGAISLPFDSMGYPYTAHIRFKLDDVPENTVLFEGADGTLFANYNGTGHIGFERGTFGIAYAFEFMTGNTPVVSANEWVSLTFACGQKDIALYINGEKAAAYATSLRPVVNSRQRDSDTFVLPVESVFENADGVIAGLRVYNRILSDAEILSLYEDETQFGFIVTPGRINVSGTDVSAETVIANYTDTAEICNVILAVYTNGRLTDVNVQTITAAPGERLTVSNSAGGFGADSTAKLMVWDGGFIPLCPAVER